MSDKEAEVRRIWYDHGFDNGVAELAKVIQQSPTLDSWSKEAVQRVIEQFMEEKSDA